MRPKNRSQSRSRTYLSSLAEYYDYRPTLPPSAAHPRERVRPGAHAELSNRLVPMARRELIRRLDELGFSGPFTGSGLEFMTEGAIRVKLPNVHRGQDIGAETHGPEL